MFGEYMKKIAKARIKKQHLLLLSVAAVALMGAVGAAGFGGAFNGFFGIHSNGYNGEANQARYNSYNGVLVHVPYNGIYNGSFTYNGVYNGMPARPIQMYNETNTIKADAAVDQCKTTYANNVSTVASNSAGLTISPTQVDQANANLQSNVTANATSWDTTISLAFFTNAYQNFMLHYLLATHQLNSTAASTLNASLNGTRTSLQNCISTNSTAQPGYGPYPTRSGFGGFGTGLGISGRLWMGSGWDR